MGHWRSWWEGLLEALRMAARGTHVVPPMCQLCATCIPCEPSSSSHGTHPPDSSPRNGRSLDQAPCLHPCDP